MTPETEYDAIRQQLDGQSGSVIQIDTGKHVTAVAVCSAVCGVCMVFAMWAAVTAWNATTAYNVQLNHMTKAEARIESLEAEVRELSHAK